MWFVTAAIIILQAPQALKKHQHVAISLGNAKSPESEEMEVAQMAEALTEQLHINDIDAFDADNPQLCAEYVKEIYQYMKELEVWIVLAALWLWGSHFSSLIP